MYGVPGDLSPWDIRFDPSRREHLDAEIGGEVRLRVSTEPGLVDAMLVVRSDGGVEGFPLEAVASTLRFTIWEVVAGPFEARVEFSLAFRAPNGKGVYYAPSGVTNAIERIDRWALEPLEPMDVPAWSRGAVIYQVFPDRFGRSGLHGPGSDLDPWGSEPRSRGFQGGNLRGITERLGYLRDLGVDLLYMNPVFSSPSNHRYDASDYYTVDPMLGSNDDLASLVEEAHRRGIKVMLDASFNHVHPRFFAFADVIEKGPDSDYWSWFAVHEWPMRLRYRPELLAGRGDLAEWARVWEQETGLTLEEVTGPGPAVEPTYEAWYGVASMPRVDLANPEARAYMLDVAAFWVREYGIDGWRMDVTRYVDLDFWNDLRRAVRKVSPDVLLLSEVMGDASPWLQGERFDATMNYTFRDLTLRFFGRDEIDSSELIDGASRMWAQYAWPVTLANQNLLGSHDTPRLLTECAGEMWRARLATIFQMTYPGSPGIYYGDEVGLEGGDDPASRGAFPDDALPPDHEIHDTIKELAALRRTESALVIGEWRPLASVGRLVAFERLLDDRRLVVAINAGIDPGVLDAGEVSTVVWGSGRIEGSTVTVPARDAVVMA